MQLGAIFPQTEIGTDPSGVRDFVEATEEMGYAHLLAFDHVLGADTTHYADTAHYTDWRRRGCSSEMAPYFI